MKARYPLAILALTALMPLAAPQLLPDGLRHAAGIPPSANAWAPFIDTDEKRIRKDVTRRFRHAPEVVQAMAIGIALDPIYPGSRIEILDADLLAGTYLSDRISLQDGREIATHSSILAESLRRDRLDIALIILERLGPEASDIQRVVIEIGKTAGRPEPDESRYLFLEAFARAGGSATTTKDPITGLSLAELLLDSKPRFLAAFLDNGLRPWGSLDPKLADAGGLSLGEVATLSHSASAHQLILDLLNETGELPSLRVASNMLANIRSRTPMTDITKSLTLRLSEVVDAAPAD